MRRLRPRRGTQHVPMPPIDPPPPDARLLAGDAGWLVDRAVHELRNSLSAIRIGVELMNRSDDGCASTCAPVLAHIDNAAQRANALSDELTDACRLASGRPLLLHPQRFGLHATVQQALDALLREMPGPAIEHDRLGDGECAGDPLRIAQFVGLAFAEIRADAPSALVIVISEVAADRFRIAMHADGAPATRPGVAQQHAARQAQAESRRRTLLLQAIAHAHGGCAHVRSEGGTGRTVDASFSSIALVPGAA